MQPESRKYLYDILRACEAIDAFVAGKRLDDYNSESRIQLRADT